MTVRRCMSVILQAVTVVGTQAAAHAQIGTDRPSPMERAIRGDRAIRPLLIEQQNHRSMIQRLQKQQHEKPEPLVERIQWLAPAHLRVQNGPEERLVRQVRVLLQDQAIAKMQLQRQLRGQQAVLDQQPVLPAAEHLKMVAPILDGRRKRLQAWFDAREAFLAPRLTLTPEQERERRNVFQQLIEKHEVHWRTRPGPVLLGDHVPIIFTSSFGVAGGLERTLATQLGRVLTREQRKLVRQIDVERRARIGDWFAERGADLVAIHLQLSRPQRNACVVALREAARRRGNGLYAFHGNHSYLQFHSLHNLRDRAADLQLSNQQEQALARRRFTLSPRQPQQQIQREMRRLSNQIRVMRSESEREQTLKRIIARVRELLKESLAIHLTELSYELDLSDEESRYLELALKGVLTRQMRTWRQDVRVAEVEIGGVRNFGNVFQAQRQNVVRQQLVTIQFPDLPKPLTDPMWLKAVRRIRQARRIHPEDARHATPPAARPRAEATGLLLGTLDRELFLTAEQIDALTPLIKATTPHVVHPAQKPVEELAIMARLLARIDQNAVHAILNGAQLQCWQLINDQFRFDGKDRATITTKHGDVTLILTADGDPPAELLLRGTATPARAPRNPFPNLVK